MSLILVFDPDPSDRERIKSALADEGWTVALDETSPGRSVDLVVVSSAHPAAEELSRRYTGEAGGPGVLLLEASAGSLTGLEVEGRLEKPFAEPGIRAAVRRCLSKVQREATERAAREAASSGAQLTSADLFGDVLAEVEDEVRPRRSGEPQASAPSAPPTEKTPRPRRRASSDAALDAEIEKTLSGVLDLGPKKKPSAPPRPKPKPKVEEEDELDALLNQTLSGLGVEGRRRRSARPAPSEPAAEPESAPEPETASAEPAPAEAAPPWDETPPPPEIPDLPAPEAPFEPSESLSSPAEVEAGASSPEPESPVAGPDPLATQRMEAVRDLPKPGPEAEPRPRAEEAAEPESQETPEPESASVELEPEEDVDEREESTPPRETEPAGETFGQYTMLERVAVGGMAEVWKARMKGMEGFQKTVAIKRILPHLTDSADFVTMFIDEAKLAAQLNHPHIIHIYDLGKIEEDYYIAMEYVEGKDLRSILNKRRDGEQGVPLGLALLVAARLASALDHAHRKRDFENRELGLVHRDVSPQNVLISYEGDIKLCDFGIVKAVAKASKTQMGALKGKLQYMSPEQAWGRVVDARSDIFSLGAVLFEMLTGERLFAGDSELSVLEAVRDCRVRPVREIAPNVPEEVESILRKALRKDPDERYQTAGDLQRDLEEVLYGLKPTPSQGDLAAFMAELFDEESAAAASRPPDRGASEAASPAEGSGGEEVAAMPPVGELEGEEGRSSRGLWIGLAAAAVLVLAVVGWLVFATSSSSDPDEEASRAAAPPPAATVPVTMPAAPVEGKEEGKEDSAQPAGDATEAGEPGAPGEARAGGKDVDLDALVAAELEGRDEALKARFEEERQRLEAEIEAARKAQQGEDEPAAGSEKAEAAPPASSPAPAEQQPARQEAEEPAAGSEKAKAPTPADASENPAPPETTPPSGPATAEPAADVPEPPPKKASSADATPPPAGEKPATTKSKRLEPAPPKAASAKPTPPPPPQVKRGQLVEIGTPGLTPPRLVSVDKPQYPPIARRMQIEGTVTVSVLVDENGAVQDVRLVQGVSQDVGLNEAALQVAESARFAPATVEDVPVKMWFNLRIPFRL